MKNAVLKITLSCPSMVVYPLPLPISPFLLLPLPQFPLPILLIPDGAAVTSLEVLKVSGLFLGLPLFLLGVVGALLSLSLSG